MKWYIACAILLAVCGGLYFGVFKLDPISLVLLCVVLWNNHVLMRRQREAAEMMKKSHDVLAANQKTLHEAMKNVLGRLRTM